MDRHVFGEGEVFNFRGSLSIVDACDAVAGRKVVGLSVLQPDRLLSHACSSMEPSQARLQSYLKGNSLLRCGKEC
jgi:hypothetical protein